MLDLTPGSDSSNPGGFVQVGKDIYFTAVASGQGALHRLDISELVVMDGGAGGGAGGSASKRGCGCGATPDAFGLGVLIIAIDALRRKRRSRRAGVSD